MVVVVIVAILAAVGYPAYTEHVKKGRRAAAQSFLLEVANKQQQFLIDARQYALGATFLADLSLTAPTEVSSFYTLIVTPAAATTPPTFTLVATPIAGTAQVSDGALALTHTGAKTRNGVAGW